MLTATLDNSEVYVEGDCVTIIVQGEDHTSDYVRLGPDGRVLRVTHLRDDSVEIVEGGSALSDEHRRVMNTILG